jgi:hypothetical protein
VPFGTVVGLANHTALVARDGREVPIDDCGAPIIDESGAIAGVVLVFREVTQRRLAEEAEAFRRANERMEQALRGSSVGMWEVAMPDGDLQNGRRYYLNLWEQLGYDPHPGDEVVSPFKPSGDQPAAITDLARGVRRGDTYQTLQGITGSGMFVALVDRGFFDSFK